MTPRDDRISPAALMMLASGFLLGSSLLIVPGEVVDQDTWAIILLGMFEGVGVSVLYCALAARFRRMTLPQICVQAYGRYLGALVGALFIWFLFHLGSLVVGNMQDFVSATLLPKTPDSVQLGIIAVVASVVTGYGLNSMGRFAQILMPYVLGSVIFTTLLLIPAMRWVRILPILTTPVHRLLLYGHVTASFPFNEAVAFMMVFPFMRGRQTSTTMVRPLAIAGLFLLVSVVRNTLVLGALNSDQVYTSYSATRMIDLVGFFTRLESLVAINSIVTAFIKIVVLLYGVCLGISQMLGLKSYRPLILPIAILMSALSDVNFNNVGENLALAIKGWPLYAPVFQIGIPALTLLIAVIRGLPAKGPGK